MSQRIRQKKGKKLTHKKVEAPTREKVKTSAQKQGVQPLSVKIQAVLRLLLDFVISVYLVLMVAGMPLYFRDGYAYIATDKADFCARINISVLRLELPLLALYLASALAVFLQRKQWRPARADWLAQLGEIWKRVSLPDIFMGLYGVALIISYRCSDYRVNSLWGAANGWYMGFMPQLMLVAAYFLIAKCWKPRKAFLYLMYLVSAAVFLLGYLNRFGFYPIQMRLSSPGFISTIGNINWYCGYAVTVLFAGVALAWGSKKGWQRILLYGYVFLGFGTLITQGSVSGIVALGAAMLALFAVSAGNGGKMCRFWAVASLLSAACLCTGLIRTVMPDRMNFNDKIINLLTTGCTPLIMTIVSLLLCGLFYILEKKEAYPKKSMKILAGIVVTIVSGAALASVIMIVINTKHPGSLGRLSEYPVFTFSEDWGSNRGTTWKAGVMCFLEQDFLHKLTGVGPDAMSAYIYRDGSEGLQGLLGRMFGNSTQLTNAHNEWLTILVDTGILGLISFGGTVVTAIGTFFKKARETGQTVPDGEDAGSVYCACGLSLLAYTVNNMFSFQQTVSLTSMVMILGMGMAFLREDKKEARK